MLIGVWMVSGSVGDSGKVMFVDWGVDGIVVVLVTLGCVVC